MHTALSISSYSDSKIFVLVAIMFLVGKIEILNGNPFVAVSCLIAVINTIPGGSIAIQASNANVHSQRGYMILDMGIGMVPGIFHFDLQVKKIL